MKKIFMMLLLINSYIFGLDSFCGTLLNYNIEEVEKPLKKTYVKCIVRQIAEEYQSIYGHEYDNGITLFTTLYKGANLEFIFDVNTTLDKSMIAKSVKNTKWFDQCNKDLMPLFDNGLEVTYTYVSLNKDEEIKMKFNKGTCFFND